VVTLLSQNEAANDEHVEASAKKHTHGVARIADNGLVKSIKQRINEGLAARGLLHSLEERPEEAHFRSDGLDTDRGRTGRHDVPEPVVAYPILKLHERRGCWTTKEARNNLLANRDTEWAGSFAFPEKKIEIVEDVRRAWIRKNAPVPECAVAPFHPVLKQCHTSPPASS